jgi:hypothetical protein
VCIQSRFNILDEPLVREGRRLIRAGKLTKKVLLTMKMGVFTFFLHIKWVFKVFLHRKWVFLPMKWVFLIGK